MEALGALLAGVSGRVREVLLASSRPEFNPDRALDELRAMAGRLDDVGGRLERVRASHAAEALRMNELLDVLYGLASLDFTRRATVTDSQSPLDALASTVNMLSEELAAAQTGLRQLASIVENSQDAIYSHALDGEVTTWNLGAEVLYGCRAHEAIGGAFKRFLPPERVRDHDGLVSRIAGGERFARFETVHQRGDGTHVPVSLSAAPLISAEETVTGVSIIARDVSVASRLSDELQRAKEAAEATTAAKSQLLANMSHEIRTPLTALLGFAELLGERTLGESERLVYAQIIRRNGEHLLSLLNDILDLSKIEAGKLHVEVVDCHIVDVLGDVASLMRPRATQRNLDFDVHLLTPVPAVLRTDPTRLRQILLNLTSNAIKFTNEGSVRIVVRYEQRARPPRVTFEVTDTGIGMSPEKVAGLFQAFQQGDASMSRRFGGTGLGLAICRPLAQALGGEISVRTAPGEGSTFALTLAPEVPTDTPMLRSLTEAPPRPGQRGASAAAQAPRALSGHVLVVEDGPDNQVLVRALLLRHGLTVTLASNGEEALREVAALAAQGRSFDLVLMDMQMPVLDGYGATAQLRRLGRKEPVVALTAHAMAGERERCMAAGCDDFLSKPIDRSALESVVGRYLRAAPDGTADAAGAHDAADADDGPIYSTYRGDPSEADLLATFVTSLPTRMADLRTARGDAAGREDLTRLAHQLKGAAGGYGFPDITRAAARLEAAVRASEPGPAVDDALDTLGRLCLRVRL